ncbi:hypothetical protein BLA29_010349 [Euroglyphus maynei]|uniref:UDP-glucose 4-epimerase n=1 Tax=Euroglyphus maynei TaxID=6958 RepID=A0A1Y3BMX7_EURMA|nr:hypothetical protein BLA29_010349 [Euroglyphus maynei]
MIEQILKDLCYADQEWSIISLRYFNPVGAHPSGLIGEDPNDIPNNLMPYISQVAVKIRPYLNVFGNDYPTDDGTGVRDYIHIDDLSNGHIVALKHMLSSPEKWFGYNPINLGTGRGISMIKSFEKTTGIKIPYKIVERRPGDLPILFANVNVANERLGWKAKKTIDEMCSSTWNWQSKNPNGFRCVNNENKILK